MKTKLFYLIGILCFLVGCQDDEGTSIDIKERKDIVLSRAEEQWASESSAFAFRLFQQVNSTETEQPNWMISPLSASMALAMTANGAGGNTLEEMKNTLGFSDFDLNGMNTYYQKLITELLNLDNSTQLGIANSIWIAEGLPILDSFVKVNQDMYDAEVRSVDFSSPDTKNIINDWCASKTNNAITEIFSSTPTGIKLSLINALYFKGIWKEKFKKSNTKEEKFTNADRSTSKVPMMNQKNQFIYTESDDFYVAELPYGNAAFSMVIFLPKEVQQLEKVIDQLTYENWAEWYSQRSSWNLEVKLPRFDLKYKKDMIGDMKALGMKDAFDASRADFSALSSTDLYLNILEQFTSLKVNEEGTEAAAVTHVGINLASPGHSGTITFHVNRPFAFMIKEKSTGTILFMGKVTKL